MARAEAGAGHAAPPGQARSRVARARQFGHFEHELAWAFAGGESGEMLRGHRGLQVEPRVARYQGWDAPFSTEQALELVTTMATAEADVPGTWLQIAVARASDGALVGDCAFASQPHEARTVEIGFTIAPEHQGCGYAREAVSLLLHYLFDHLGKHRVTASCDARNVPSARMLQAVGMRQEGHLVDSTWSKGEWTDDLLFAILRREWPS